MVLPWMEDGNIRDYLKKERDAGRLCGQEFLDAVNRWVRADFYCEHRSAAHLLTLVVVRDR